MKKIAFLALFIAVPATAMNTPPPAVAADPAGGPVAAVEYTRLLVLQAPVGKKLQTVNRATAATVSADFNELQAQMLVAKMAQAAPNRSRFDAAAASVHELVPAICASLGGC